MIAALEELFRHRELLWTITCREIRVRYKQSVMGILWALFMPLVIVGAGLVVRIAYGSVSGKGVDVEALATVAVKSVPWAFAVASVRFASMSLIGNRNLVTKIYLPRTIFPVAAVLSQTVDLGVALAVLGAVLAIAGNGLQPYALLALPLLGVLFVLVLGTAIVVSAGSLFFRDVKYLVEAGLTFAIFFTPVFYDAEMFGRYESLVLLNPVAPILEALAGCVVRGEAPAWPWVAYSAAFALAMLAFALRLFRRLEPAFAESI